MTNVEDVRKLLEDMSLALSAQRIGASEAIMHAHQASNQAYLSGDIVRAVRTRCRVLILSVEHGMDVNEFCQKVRAFADQVKQMWLPTATKSLERNQIRTDLFSLETTARRLYANAMDAAEAVMS
jgi:succinyl-CoA synthetase beta subunit